MVSQNELTSLRGFASSDKHPVVSLYLNVNGSSFPTRADYETEFSILVNNTRKPAIDELGLSRDQEGGLDNDLRSIGEFLTLQFHRNGARSLVIFSCAAEGLWQAYPLHIPVENRLYVDFKPQVAPLAEILSEHERLLVLVTNKETARIFNVHAGEIAELPGVMDEVLKRHTQGGWEQNKLQRRHDLQVRNHLKRAADAAMDVFKQERFDRVAVGIADELWPDLEKVMHPWLRERMVGHFSVDINASSDEIMTRVSLIEDERHLQEQQTLLDSLGPELEAGKMYVGGLDDVLAMLNQRRVDMLLVEEGYREPGKHCDVCNTLEFGEETCPACGRRAEKIADVVEEAKELAVRQDAVVRTIPLGHPAMERAGHIAARLRY